MILLVNRFVRKNVSEVNDILIDVIECVDSSIDTL